MKDYKEFVTNIAQKAGEIIRTHFSLGIAIEWKKDNTPLTIADTAVNKLVIEEIRQAFPDHSIIGEEASDLTDSEYVWVCDPIDGTVPFSHGYAAFVFSLALTKNGESIVGVIYDPILNRMFYAEKGKGAFLNDQKISVSTVSDINNAIVCLDADFKLINLRNKLIDKGAYAVGFIGAQFACSLVACGQFVAEVFEYQNPWDAAAVKIVVEEAGGKVTDILGNEQRYDRKINGFLASNGVVHTELLELIKKSLI